jgi:hypothetical protein
MWIAPYVAEKLRIIEEERLGRLPPRPPERPRPLLRPLVRLTGRTLRRLGAGLELWATPSSQAEHAWEQQREQGRYPGG